jgi:hypothetical protein
MTKIKSEKRAGYITSVPSNIHGVQREPLWGPSKFLKAHL